MEPLNRLKEDIRKELGNLDVVIGWEQGYDALHATPLFIHSDDDVERLIWSPLCAHNLVSYLPGLKGRRVGIVVKGCDSRSVVQLLQEGLINREELVIFGVPCTGVVDLAKLRARLSAGPITAVSIKDGTVSVTTPQGMQEIPLEEVLPSKCRSCRYPTPLVSDHMAGDPLEPRGSEDLLYDEVRELDDLDVEARRAFWERELNRCIRCYACRNACPLCVCQDHCAAESRNPHWLSQRSEMGEKVMWQLMHALHVAGRCTDCGECERACPMDIPIQRIRAALNREIRELFGYEAGVNVEDTPPLYTFKVEEPTIKEKDW